MRQKYTMEKYSLFHNWCWGNGTATCKRMKPEYFFISYKDIHSKQTKDLNIRPEAIILLGENIEHSLINIIAVFLTYNKILFSPKKE